MEVCVDSLLNTSSFEIYMRSKNNKVREFHCCVSVSHNFGLTGVVVLSLSADFISF